MEIGMEIVMEIGMETGMEQWWNDADRGKTEILGEKHYTAWVVDG
jgi:hypothetical protein